MNENMNMEQDKSEIMNDNAVINDGNNNDSKKHIDECIELKNIEYQTMLLNKNSSSSNAELRPKNSNNISLKDVNAMLETEKGENKLSWSRLTKTNRIKKIYDYVDVLKDKHELESQDVKDIKSYIKKCFDRKMLSKAKQIIYDKNKGIITDIPSLIILSKDHTSKNKKRFTLKLNESKTSTLKNLSKGNASSRSELMKRVMKKEKTKDKTKNKTGEK